MAVGENDGHDGVVGREKDDAEIGQRVEVAGAQVIDRLGDIGLDAGDACGACCRQQSPEHQGYQQGEGEDEQLLVVAFVVAEIGEDHGRAHGLKHRAAVGGEQDLFEQRVRLDGGVPG